ncbi:MAG: substrate-binding domain-containing protein, partial [Gammaproteobacteria bacterium]
GYGVERVPVMHNDFVIVGPANDPANISGADTAAAAFRRLTANRMPFISRGDSSGTHLKELAIWEAAGLKAGGRQYMAVGQGMGAVLQVAEQYQAYTLTDRGTYIAYEDKIELEILFEGDPMLKNPYHIIAVNPDKHAHVKHEAAIRYIEFITSAAGQEMIADFKIADQQLFYPDALAD